MAQKFDLQQLHDRSVKAAQYHESRNPGTQAKYKAATAWLMAEAEFRSELFKVTSELEGYHIMAKDRALAQSRP